MLFLMVAEAASPSPGFALVLLREARSVFPPLVIGDITLRFFFPVLISLRSDDPRCCSNSSQMKLWRMYTFSDSKYREIGVHLADAAVDNHAYYLPHSYF